jgi:y4mF family transcriptional regulator
MQLRARRFFDTRITVREYFSLHGIDALLKFPNGNIYCKWALRKRKIPERECCVKGYPMKYTPPQIGALIRSTRKSLGVTQRDLALTSGTGLRFVVDLERGKETCEIGKALTILQTLGIRLTLTPPAAAEAKEK